MNKQDLDAIAQRRTYCEPFGESVSLSRVERDELVVLVRRYFYLRDASVEVPAAGVDVAFWDDHCGEAIRGEALDEAIDAAMAKGKT